MTCEAGFSILPVCEPKFSERFGMRSQMKLYDYTFSNASVRTRIILYLKGVPFERIEIDLLTGKRKDGQPFSALNPQGMVPTLIDGDLMLNQSIAIAEYLDELFPTPKLFPSDIKARAFVRCLAMMIACDGQPLVNLRVRRFLTNTLGLSMDTMIAWMQHWLGDSLRNYETMISQHSSFGNFSCGDELTLADIVLVPQILLAKRFGVDVSRYRHLMDIYSRCVSLEPFQRAISEYILEDPGYGLTHSK